VCELQTERVIISPLLIAFSIAGKKVIAEEFIRNFRKQKNTVNRFLKV
jgi:hypothetical protein